MSLPSISPALAIILAASSGIAPEMFEPREYQSKLLDKLNAEIDHEARISAAELKRQRRAERNLRNR
jgi:hypothetical protein